MKHTLSAKWLLTAAIVTMTAMQLFAQSPISVKWTMGTNGAEKGYYSSTFVIKNVSDAPLAADWQFYFSQFSRTVKLPEACPVTIKEVSTTYYQVTPNANYRTLAPGDSLVVPMLMRGTLVNVCYVPMGGHVVLGGDTAHPLPVNIALGELRNPGQWQNRPNDYPDGNWLYNFNRQLANVAPQGQQLGCYNIFPTPKSVRLTGGTSSFAPGVKVITDDARLRSLLEGGLHERGINTNGMAPIRLIIDPAQAKTGDEAYVLIVSGGQASIKGATRQAIINGVTTLLAAFDHSSQPMALDDAVVTDAPDLPYRGFMLDISRNFQKYDDILRFIDLMAYYKLNRLQFHFADDEAWRLEIPGLPELTQVGARRGCTLDEKHFLAQIFDGNGNPNDPSQSANGYITRAQFIQLLKYADARGIKVIPEIESPGHARSEIVAMKARRDRYAAIDPERATEFQLWDDDDKPNFNSAQSYHDNVLCVAQEGVYRFMAKVTDELADMYAEAGLKLDVLHIGGDEVASGAWDASPAVQKLMKEKKITTQHGVHEYYVERIYELLYKQRGIKIAGWQEVASDHSAKWDKKHADAFSYLNAWSTQGKKISVPYELANKGYPVVLSNVTNFYIDMAYSWHQYDKGLHWGGTCDEYATWYAQPWNIYHTARIDYDGTPIDFAAAEAYMPALKQRQNIIGVQGQLWAETMRSFTQLQYYVLPKIFGLSERGWNATPEFDDQVKGSFERARAAYNAKVGLVELPVVDNKGLNFRLGMPGIKIENGYLIANTQYPGEVVRYTLDGTEPTLQSPVLSEPVPLTTVPQLIKAKAYYLDHSSLTTYLWP